MARQPVGTVHDGKRLHRPMSSSRAGEVLKTFPSGDIFKSPRWIFSPAENDTCVVFLRGLVVDDRSHLRQSPDRWVWCDCNSAFDSCSTDMRCEERAATQKLFHDFHSSGPFLKENTLFYRLKANFEKLNTSTCTVRLSVVKSPRCQQYSRQIQVRNNPI